MKTNIAIDISPPIPYLIKFLLLRYRPKCCLPIKLQDSLKCNISRKKWIVKFSTSWCYCFCVCISRHAQSTQNKKFISLQSLKKTLGMESGFYLEIKTKVFCKLIVPFLVCVVRYAPSTQNNTFSRKTWRMKLFFCLQISIKVFFKKWYHFRCVAMQYVKKEASDKVDFFPCR